MKKTRFFLWIRFILGCVGWMLLLEMSFQRTPHEFENFGQAEERLKITLTSDAIDEKKQASIDRQPQIKKVVETSEAAEPENPRKIRVVLMDDNYQSYYHSDVLLEMDGKQYTFSDETQAEQITLSPKQNGIRVLSIFRNGEHPIYDGTMEIRKEKEGFLLINELPLEDYLKAVIPSEMPSDYEMEALKAQAVCARTYALKQIEEKRKHLYYADVDDSVGCQVYRKEKPEEKTSKAVEETAGQVLKCEDALIEAYYFSTSAGATSTDDVWGVAQSAEYLKSVSCSFDETFPWRYWSVSIPWENLERFLHQTYGITEKLLDVSVQKKNQSGAVTELVLTTASDSFKREGEYAVREALSPKGCRIVRKNGEETEGGELLPSAYITLHIENGKSVNIEGSGYGHGVGMSQTAANEMAKEGYLFDEILQYFYQNITIEKI